jgi:hypothetical protein
VVAAEDAEHELLALTLTSASEVFRLPRDV